MSPPSAAACGRGSNRRRDDADHLPLRYARNRMKVCLALYLSFLLMSALLMSCSNTNECETTDSTNADLFYGKCLKDSDIETLPQEISYSEIVEIFGEGINCELPPPMTIYRSATKGSFYNFIYNFEPSNSDPKLLLITKTDQGVAYTGDVIWPTEFIGKTCDQVYDVHSYTLRDR
jgi:hypothetical protein